MGFPIASAKYPGGTGAAANPAYSGVFIPEIWSGKLIEKFYDASVIPAISNTMYEGEIKNKGDKVIIRTRPSITIRQYEADQVLTVERPSSSVVELEITEGLYWNVVLDDVMEVQSDIDLMNIWAEDASEQLKIEVDKAVLRTLYAGVAAANKGATAGRFTDNDLGITTDPVIIVPRAPGSGEAEVIDLIVRMGLVLDEQNCPQSGRWMTIPAWMAAMIKRSELRDASLTGDGTSMLRNGRVGMIDRFELYVSNLLPTGTGDDLEAGEWEIFAGVKQSLTFAGQLVKTETLRAESTFGTLMRGLKVYGSEVIDGTLMAGAVVKAGS